MPLSTMYAVTPWPLRLALKLLSSCRNRWSMRSRPQELEGDLVPTPFEGVGCTVTVASCVTDVTPCAPRTDFSCSVVRAVAKPLIVLV
ncbi:hypothetical protein ACFV30_07775 [Streptomyces sp. NPDC059752]|uniref:hypothetical protein n=1 Tax=unclassified Streptomyces TaxID=2593676 RepID=UPI0036563B7A